MTKLIVTDWSHPIESIGLYCAKVALAQGLQILGFAPLLGPNDDRLVISLEGDGAKIELVRTKVELHGTCCFAT